MAIGIARFAVKSTETARPEFRSAPGHPQDSVWSSGISRPASAILRFFRLCRSSLLPSWPMCSRGLFSGMENAGAIFYDESTSRIQPVNPKACWPMKSPTSGLAIWLLRRNLRISGSAKVSLHPHASLFGFRYGPDSLRSEMKADRYSVIEFSRSGKRPVVDSVSSFRRLLNANSYQKGSWILHMLRRQLGDSVFAGLFVATMPATPAEMRIPGFSALDLPAESGDLSWF